MAQAPSAQAPAAPSGPDADDAQGAEPSTITITCNGDGTYSIEQGDSGDDQGEPADPSQGPDSEQPPVQVQSVADVLHVVKQMLAQGAGGSAASAWNQEASTRDASGMPQQPGGAGGPPMSM